MKTGLVFLYCLCLTVVTYAQLDFSVQKVSAEDVPANAIATQAASFSASVLTWEKQTASAKGNAITRYVASFTEQTKTVTRARYTNNGTGLSATTYYTAEQLPTVLQDSAATNYPNYKLESGEKILYIPTKQNLFRIRLRKGAQKLVVYVDNNGNELDKGDLPLEIYEDENVSY